MRIPALGAPRPIDAGASPGAVRLWCQLVRGSARNPTTSGPEGEAAPLWHLYLDAARVLWKRIR